MGRHGVACCCVRSTTVHHGRHHDVLTALCELLGLKQWGRGRAVCHRGRPSIMTGLGQAWRANILRLPLCAALLDRSRSMELDLPHRVS
jgi:hypothetical protein